MSKAKAKKPMAVRVPREVLYQKKVERMFGDQAAHNQKQKLKP